MITNPENLSKDRLKKELSKRKITFSPTKNKDYYVSLYREKIMSGTKARQRSEFSSDDEVLVRRGQRTPPREKRFTKVASADHYLKQVTNISDTELASELKKYYNVDVGPITATTRGVYERKLAKLMAEKAKGSISNSSSGITIASDSDEEFSSEEEDEETDIVQQIKVPTQKPKPSTPSFAVAPRSPSSSYYLRPRPRPLEKQQPRPLPKPHKPVVIQDDSKFRTQEFSHPYRSSWCSVWLVIQLLILLVTFLIAVIVFQYVLNEHSQVVDWIITRYSSLSNMIAGWSSNN